jgi:hypothetical protein
VRPRLVEETEARLELAEPRQDERVARVRPAEESLVLLEGLLELEAGLVAAREPEVRERVSRADLHRALVELLGDLERARRVEVLLDARVRERERRVVLRRGQRIVELRAPLLDPVLRVSAKSNSVTSVRESGTGAWLGSRGFPVSGLYSTKRTSSFGRRASWKRFWFRISPNLISTVRTQS